MLFMFKVQDISYDSVYGGFQRSRTKTASRYIINNSISLKKIKSIHPLNPQ